MFFGRLLFLFFTDIRSEGHFTLRTWLKYCVLRYTWRYCITTSKGHSLDGSWVFSSCPSMTCVTFWVQLTDCLVVCKQTSKLPKSTGIGSVFWRSTNHQAPQTIPQELAKKPKFRSFHSIRPVFIPKKYFSRIEKNRCFWYKPNVWYPGTRYGWTPRISFTWLKLSSQKTL